MSKNVIRDDEHIFIAGMTGCGKTKLAEYYASGMDNVIKIDTKQEYTINKKLGKEIWLGLQEGKDFEVCHSLEDVFDSEANKIIYEVPYNEQNEEYYNNLCEWVFKNGDMRLWVDELMTVCPNAFSIPFWLKAIYTAGRSNNASVMACTQRPAGIPQITIANSTHFFTFALTVESDRKRMVNITGCNSLEEVPPKFAFWYFKMGMQPGDEKIAKLKL